MWPIYHLSKPRYFRKFEIIAEAGFEYSHNITFERHDGLLKAADIGQKIRRA